MKDMIQITAIGLLILALLAAAPVAGFIIGIGVAAWFLVNAWKEERNARNKNP